MPNQIRWDLTRVPKHGTKPQVPGLVKVVPGVVVPGMVVPGMVVPGTVVPGVVHVTSSATSNFPSAEQVKSRKLFNLCRYRKCKFRFSVLSQ